MYIIYMGVSFNGGTQQPWFFLQGNPHMLPMCVIPSNNMFFPDNDVDDVIFILCSHLSWQFPTASSLPGKQFPAKCLQPAGWLRAAVNWIELEDSKRILMIPLGKFLSNLPFVSTCFVFLCQAFLFATHRLALH